MAEHIQDPTFLADIAQIKEKNQKEKESTSQTDSTATATEEKKEGAEKQPDQKTISQEELISQLKASGIDVSSLDELKTKISPKQEAKKKSDEEIFTEALQFGVQNGKIKLEDYDKAVKYKATADKEIVKEKFIEKYRAKYPRSSDEEAELKFNKKFAAEEKVEEIKGNPLDPEEITDRKVSYILDDDELKEEAERIRKGYWNPIEKVKEEYSAHQKQEDINKDFFENAEKIKKEIPNKVTFDIGDEKNPESFEYAIDDTFKQQIESAVLNIYANHKGAVLRGNAKEEDFNLKNATDLATRSIMFRNILKSYGKTQKDAGILEGAEPFKNSTKGPLETTIKEKNGKQPKETPEEIAARFEREFRGFGS